MPEWLTPAEAAAYLKISRPTLYRWCAEGILPYHELAVGGRKPGRRFLREDLDALLRKGKPSTKAK